MSKTISQEVSNAVSDVIIALIPITFVASFVFGFKALLVLASCMLGAVAGEIFARKIKGEKASLNDGKALLTGLLLALILPTAPWWVVIPLYTSGGFLATALFREYFGVLGLNRFNPALLAWLFLLIARTGLVYLAPFLLQFNPSLEPWLLVDTVTGATPLIMSAAYGLTVLSNSNIFLIYLGGVLGEASGIALLLGAAYLLYKGHISWHIPASILGTVFLLTAVLGQDPLFHVLAGGVFLGAFFIATDWATSPVSDKGKVIFGIGIGILTVFFRLYAAPYWVPVGGVAFAILIMNAFVPAIDRSTGRIKIAALTGTEHETEHAG